MGALFTVVILAGWLSIRAFFRHGLLFCPRMRLLRKSRSLKELQKLATMMTTCFKASTPLMLFQALTGCYGGQLHNTSLSA